MSKKHKLFMAAGTVAVVAALFLYQNRESTPEPLVRDESSLRQTPSGPVVGYADQYNTQAWLGIPYAQAPVGELRWKAPRPGIAWSETREALKEGSPCIQYWGDGSGIAGGSEGQVVGSEDCLSLNIWAPAMTPDALPNATERMPVMVWLHGGGNTSGTANVYRAHHLAGSQNVIVVGVNHRLGLMGWFSHSALRKTSENASDASGNYGLLDIIAALKWVQTNIASFGGDPSNVTIFGESAGGRNVYALVASPLANGLFHKAIVQSGSVLTIDQTWAENFTDESPRGAPNSAGDMLLKWLQKDGLAMSVADAKNHLRNMEDKALMDYLRNKTPEELLSIFTPGGFGMYSLPTNIQDGYVLPKQSTLELFRSGQGYNKVPLMAGTNRDEHKVFQAYDPRYIDKRLGVLPRIKDLEFYNRMAAYYSDQWKVLSVDEPARALAQSSTAPVYTYRFDWDESPATWAADFESLIGAGHAMEISFVFGDFEGGLSFPFLLTDENLPGREYISRAMMGYWGSFARTGDPAQGGNADMPQWKPWQRELEQQMVFDTEADGGVRMSVEPLTVDGLKARLASDQSFDKAEDQCRLFGELFLTSFQSRDYWDAKEYEALADEKCKAYDPYELALGEI